MRTNRLGALLLGVDHSLSSRLRPLCNRLGSLLSSKIAVAGLFIYEKYDFLKDEISKSTIDTLN